MTDEPTGIYIDCTPEELAAWKTAVALGYSCLTVEEWARNLLNWRAAMDEQRFTGEPPEWWRRMVEGEHG